MTGCAELEKSLRECMDVPVCFLPSYLSACLFVCLSGKDEGFLFFL